MSRTLLATVAASALLLLSSCAGGGSGGTSSDTAGQTPSSNGTVTTSPAPLTDAGTSVPVVGDFLADCLDTGSAVIQSFSATGPLSVSATLPTVAEALATTANLPIVGGLVPSSTDPSKLVPSTVAQITALLPGGVVPSTLPVIGSVPVVCSSLPIGSVANPTEAVGIVPVVGNMGTVIGVVLTTVDNLQAGGVPDVTHTVLPSGTDTLPATLGSAVSGILSLLPLSS